LLATLALWHRVHGTVAVSSIRSTGAELFYWTTILFSQTLGTALGDWSADDVGLGLGYEKAALIFAICLATIALLYLVSRVSHTLLFWLAFVLTRPLGATLGDWLDKPVASGGLALSRYTASAVLLLFMLACMSLDRRKPGTTLA
jgi:uncharacterized membrane-anchored protein